MDKEFNGDVLNQPENESGLSNKRESVEVKEFNDKKKINDKSRKKKKKHKLYFSFRHTASLITLWGIFLASFIVGFIVHFDTTRNVTASSIIWTFSVIICVASILYSFNYYRCTKAKSDEELQKYLKLFPC